MRGPNEAEPEVRITSCRSELLLNEPKSVELLMERCMIRSARGGFGATYKPTGRVIFPSRRELTSDARSSEVSSEEISLDGDDVVVVVVVVDVVLEVELGELGASPLAYLCICFWRIRSSRARCFASRLSCLRSRFRT